jgi:hypothetical protein
MIRSTMVSGLDFSHDSFGYTQAALSRSWRCEIRDRLNVILGFAELLSDDPAASPRNRRFAENIRAAGMLLLHAMEQDGPLVPDPWRRVPLEEDPSERAPYAENRDPPCPVGADVAVGSGAGGTEHRVFPALNRSPPWDIDRTQEPGPGA